MESWAQDKINASVMAETTWKMMW